jgi:rhodanese-related sulfurtransferase
MKHSPRFLRLVDDAKKRIREVTIAEVREMLDRGDTFHLIDVREASEFANGHIPGARHLCKGVIERDVEVLISEQNAMIVLYCGGGFRSALAADNLRVMGYANVASMDGGWREWTAAGFPIERPR